MDYNFSTIEDKWRKFWQENDTYKVENDTAKPKCYVLEMFPYPSGKGLHVGHPLGYIAGDIYARYKVQKGFNVLHPMGCDAFGLPAEQYAIQTGQHPAKTTAENIKTFRRQLESLSFNYDWSRFVQTSDPDYYKWTQWIFIQLFHSWYNPETDKAEPIETLVKQFEANDTDGWNSMSEKQQQEKLMDYRLAYLSYADVNWCPALGTVLANDEVVNGVSERGGHPVFKKSMRQWFLRITAYAERLLRALDDLDWSESLKEQQRNWIGRSEGASVNFKVDGHDEQIEIFTTRPDTIFGATYMVLAPEHPLVDKLTTADQKKEIDEYLQYVQSRSQLERQSEVKKVTGAFTGAYAINPLNNEKIPIWTAEYVLMGYGTGAIMAVPSDDDRDNAFAKKFDLPIIEVIDKSDYPNADRQDKVGKLINSGFLNGMEVLDAISATIDKLEEMGIGERRINYRMRDAGFSRQRYWGEPFPVIYKDDIPYTIDESELPLTLPEVESYKPTGTGESPIAAVTDWVNRPEGTRETDTMPGYAGSSWYWLRYMDPDNPNRFVGEEAEEYWGNVDLYIGGAEHAVGHLLYSRFWQNFLFDRGWVSKKEPFQKMVNQGMIQGRTDFIYQFSLKPSWVKKASIDLSFDEFLTDINDDIPKVYVTKELAEEILHNKGGYHDLSNQAQSVIEKTKVIFKEFEVRIKKRYPQIDKLDFKVGQIIPLRVDINFVKQDVSREDNDLLDIERFKSTHDNIEMHFIKNANGDFVCRAEGEKMSKSKLNVQTPDDIIQSHGADTLRMYEMFLGPIEDHKPWNTQGIDGVHKFLRKLWRLFYEEGAEQNDWKVVDEQPTKKELKTLHKTIKKVGEDVESLSFNTAVSAFMICVNELTEQNCHKKAVLQELVKILSPFAPHIAEELWHALGNEGSVTQQDWPDYNEEYLKEDAFEYPVSVNGKVRAKIELPADISQDAAQEEVLALDQVQKWMEGKPLRKFIYVKGRIINVVV